MPYPIRPGISSYIRELADVIEKDMREISEINKVISECEEDKEKLVMEVMNAKKKMNHFLLFSGNPNQLTLDKWIDKK